MDEETVHKNADRVAAIFNALSIFVLVIGALAAIVVLISGFVAGGFGDGGGSFLLGIIGGILGALVIAVYTLIAWAGVQLSALVAGYIKVKTGVAPPATPQPPYGPN